MKFMDDRHMEVDGREVELPTTKSNFTLPVEQAQEPELKNLPGPLKNAHLRKNTQPVIDSNKLSNKEWKELITLFNKYTKDGVDNS